MKSRALSGVVSDVRSLLENNMYSLPVIAQDLQTLSMNELIEKNVVAAIGVIAARCPVGMIDQADHVERVATDNRVRVEKVLRILQVESDGWRGGAAEVMPANTSMHRQARDKYAVGVASTAKPLAFLTHRQGLVEVEVYPDPDPEKVRVEYVEVPAVVEGQVKVDDGIYDAVLRYACYLVGMTQGWANAAMYRQEAMVLIGGERGGAEADVAQENV